MQRGLWPGGKSRMSREAPVRFREGLGVKLPRATRLIMGFACEEDARRVLEVLPKRFGKYGLTLHPEKTRLVPFRRPRASSDRARQPGPPPGTFDLLGFRHYWARSERGNWVVRRKTEPNRFRRALRRIAQWCRANRHRPLAEQHRTLGQKVRGHNGYYGITGNAKALQRFRLGVERLWRKWLSRRHRRRPFPWPHFRSLLQRFPLPPPLVVHSVYRRAANP